MQEQLEQGERAAINGYLFGNLPGLEMIEGERVRWYLFGLCGQVDVHTAHWHGTTVIEDGRRRTDVIELMPARMKVADMVADNPGGRLFHCHVAEHMMEGMFARYTVHSRTDARREPARFDPQFLGLRRTSTSLLIRRAEARPDLASGENSSIAIEGDASVYEAFSTFTQAITIQLGGNAIVLKPNRQGFAQTKWALFRARNASRYGVVYGGSLHFEIFLSGTEWFAEFQREAGAGGRAISGDPGVEIPFGLEIGNSAHRTCLRITTRTP